MYRIQGLKIKISIMRHLIAGYIYDGRRYLKHSTEVDMGKFSEQRLVGYIIARYHIIEKGLTMSDMRPGFGKQAVESLVKGCNIFLNKFGKGDLQVNTALSILKCYIDVHKKNDYKIDRSLTNNIEELIKRYDFFKNESQVFEFSNEVYFNTASLSFRNFALSRHSLRNFSGKAVQLEVLRKAIELAQCAPTSCNRQPIRVRIISDKDLMNKILQIQTGNRGFGHMADKIIVLSADLSVYNEVRERNLGYIDSGIYAMNLMYALHYYKVGTCALNWSADIENDKKIRKLIKVPDSEIITLLVACGIPPDKFKIANSVRRPGEDITIVY
jgi:nitroreductase